MMSSHSLEKRMRGQPRFEVGITNGVRFPAQFIGFAFREPPNLGTIMQYICRRRPNGNVGRMDQVEVHKTLGWKRTEFGLVPQIIESSGHGDFARHFDSVDIARRGVLNVLVPVVCSYSFLLNFDQQIRCRLGSSVRARVVSKADVSEEAVRLRDREPRQVAGPGQRRMTRRFEGFFRYRERGCFHATTRRPAAADRSTTVVICRAKLALPPTRLLSRQRRNNAERNSERSSGGCAVRMRPTS